MSWSVTILIDTFGVVLALITIIVTYYTWSFTYWKRRNIPYLEPKFPFGNLQNLFKPTASLGIEIKYLYDQLKKRKLPHGGIYFFTRPIYILTDLEYVKNVFTRDFQYFADRGIYYNERDDPLSAHLLAVGGQRWRSLRVNLTPAFTAAKTKTMFQTLLECEGHLQEKLEVFYQTKTPIDIKDVLACYTTDVIGSCAFGLECNTFKDEDSPFRRYAKEVLASSILRDLSLHFSNNFPKLAKLLKMRVVPKDVADFFTKIAVDNVEHREKSQYNRPDFMQLLIDLKNKHTLTMEDVVAQSFLFFLAGYETSSATMTWALYELAKNQHLQDKLRDEIDAVLAEHEGKLTYDAIQDMKFMDQVLNETLRKYPPVPFLTRQCVKDYKVPDQDVIIEKGTNVMIPVLGIHRDERNYPEPETFDPERFNEDNSKSRHPYSYIPFGQGPRICIGLKFGLMQSKVGLTVLRKYRFTLNPKTKQPLKFAATFILAADGDVWLDAEKI